MILRILGYSLITSVVAAFIVAMFAANWRGWPQLAFVAGIFVLTWLSCLEAKRRDWLNKADRWE